MLVSAPFSLSFIALALAVPVLATPGLDGGAQLAGLAEWTVGTLSRVGSDGAAHTNTVWEFIDCGMYIFYPWCLRHANMGPFGGDACFD
jgi:hypothetical protein